MATRGPADGQPLGAREEQSRDDPKPVPENARTRVERMIAAGYRRRQDGIEDPQDTRVYWSFVEIGGMSQRAFDAVMGRKKVR
jgi:hypothetical protein